MIILRRLGRQSDCRVILSDPLYGETDGINQVFSVSNEYTPGKIEIIYNGQVLISGEDFLETGPKEITFVFLKPTDSSLFSANYETGECDNSIPVSTTNFLNLEDTPSSYTNQAGKVIVVNENENGLKFSNFEPGTTTFIDLTDTPTTYSGFENYYVKVKSDGSGLDFISPEGDIQEGIENISQDSDNVNIVFSRQFVSNQYIVTAVLENKLDLEPSIYPVLIKNKTITGFTAHFSGEIDSNNYYLNWRATLSGTGGITGCSTGNCLEEVIDDNSPQLGGNLEVGSNLLLLDTTPNNTTISGGFIRGASGEASYMYVSDNSATDDGFACPLYMKSNGTWGTCTAVSGTIQMPCMALALEGGDGDFKNILWKGIIRKGEWSWTPGKVIYISTVEGAITDVKPNGGSWQQPIGIAIGSDTIRFDPGFNPGS